MGEREPNAGAAANATPPLLESDLGDDPIRLWAMERAGIGVVRCTSEGEVLGADRTAAGLLEHAIEAAGTDGKRILMTYGCAGRRPWEVVLAAGEVHGFVCQVKSGQGLLLDVSFDGIRHVGEGGEETAVLLVRAAKTAQADRDGPYRAIFDAVVDGVLVHDVETGAIVDANRRGRELFEAARAERLTQSPQETTTAGTQADGLAFDRLRRAAAGEPQVFAWPALSSTGEGVWLEVSLTKARVGEVDRVIAVTRDITQRKNAEQALRRSEERYRAIVNATHDIMWALDTTGNFTFVNTQGERATGFRFEDWEGTSFAPLIHPDDLEKSLTTFAATMRGESVRYEVRVLDAQGQVRHLMANLEPLRDDGVIVGMVGLGTDITDRKRLEDELHKAQKLESLGLLAGGIAHDFNNILTAIVGSVALAKRAREQPELQAETLEMAERACLRARDLTQQLLTFSRGGAPLRKPGSIAELLRETAEFALRGSNVRCELALEPDLRMVDMDAGQINQVVNNVVINAAQSMPHGGTVRLRAGNVEVTGTHPGSPSLAAGHYVRVSVQDEGIGIPAEHLPNIFDPYFTTKADGTGLGLATSYSIVRRHDGYIEVETVPGRGTTFHIYLQATDRKEKSEPHRRDGKAVVGGRVLLMDDEEMILEVGSRMLQLFGYEVEITKDGAEALARYREAMVRGERFDAVILDLTVPGGMGGRDAARALRKLDAGAFLIASSGYSTDPVMADHKMYGFDAVVAKPYVPEDLERALKRRRR